MNQNIWGSHLWFSLHTISLNYPLKPNKIDKRDYKNFFINLQEVIPCSVCKTNYKRHLNEHPIDNYLHNRKAIVYWVIDMHNMVNVEIGKKVYSYDKVIKKYEDVYNKKIILDSNSNDINDTCDNCEMNENYINNIPLNNIPLNNIPLNNMVKNEINYNTIFIIIIVILILFIIYLLNIIKYKKKI
jgi:hypothetical protein